jgi:hypothetical protein
MAICANRWAPTAHVFRPLSSLYNLLPTAYSQISYCADKCQNALPSIRRFFHTVLCFSLIIIQVTPHIGYCCTEYRRLPSGSFPEIQVCDGACVFSASCFSPRKILEIYPEDIRKTGPGQGRRSGTPLLYVRSTVLYCTVRWRIIF